MRAVVLMIVAMVAIAHAQPSRSADVSQALAQIAKLEGQLEYEQALMLATRTIARGISSHDQLADLNLIAGRLAAGLDHPDEAQVHFAIVLALRPNTELVAGTSPKLQAPFDAARAMNPKLAGSFELVANRARVLIEHDALHLVSGMRVTQGTDSPTTGGLVATTLDEQKATLLEAVDEHGNELFWAQFPARRHLEELAKHCAVDCHRHAPHLPLLSDWKTYAALTGVALVVAGVSAQRFDSARNEWDQLNGEGGHDYSQLHGIEQRAQRWAIAADVSFGVTALAAVASGVLFAERDHLWVMDVAFTGNGAAYVARF